jgi:predicted ATPase
MFKIKELYIKGFKDPNREITIKFSDSPVTIIYGENGSGKTTLLKVIQAILRYDIEFLQSQNIKECKVTYVKDGKENQLQMLLDINEDLTILLNSIQLSNEDYYNELNNLSSILFGVNRGFVDENQIFLDTISQKIKKNKELIEQIHQHVFQTNETKLIRQSLSELIQNIATYKKSNTIDITAKHSVINNLDISAIELSLRTSFEKGKNAVLTGIGNAFFNTIDNAINPIDKIVLPLDFQSRFNQRKVFFNSFVDNLPNSATKQKLQLFIDAENHDLSKEADLFKALLKNMLEAAEQDEKDNIDLKSINTLISTFNEFIIDKKKLVLDAVKSSINFQNGQKHPLSDLSSGERHLLSFLTLFLIVARDRNFFLIDEPEISLSMKWQRRLLELLSEFSPNSQIIVATHSPSIANRNYANQVELV